MNGRYGNATSASLVVPTITAVPARRARTCSSIASRVFPTPASPPMTTTWPPPRWAASKASSRRLNSCSRPNRTGQSARSINAHLMELGRGDERLIDILEAPDGGQVIHKGPALEIPDVPLARFVLQRATAIGDRPALIDGVSGRQLTYGALADGVNRVACALRRRGFKKRDVFAIFSPNLPEYPIAFHAVASLGGIVTTLNSLYTPRELSDQLRDCHARYLLTVPAFMDRAAEAISGLPIDEVFIFGEAPGATPFSELISQAAEPLTVEIDPAEDVVALPYSSGTTGLAKGVMLTHRNLIANVLQAEQRIHLREGERVLGVMPFYHIYGMTVIMNLALHAGATVVTMPRFERETFLRVLQDHRVSQ